MILELVKERNGKEFIEELKETYGSMENLRRLIEKNPGHPLYTLDLDDWLYYLEHPDDTIKTTETIFLNDLDNLLLSDLKLLDVIRRKHPKSIKNLSELVKKDIKTIQPKVKKLEKSGLLKLEEGPKNSKIPVVNYNKIVIEI